AVLAFSRDQMANNKSWDWVTGLNILEAEARAIPRPVPPAQKRGIFGGKQQPEMLKNQFDEKEIDSPAALLRSSSCLDAAQNDNTTTWREYVNTPDPNASLRFLSEHPKLVEDEKLLNWLDDQITQNVAAGAMDAVKNLATKSAVVIVVRQFGLQQARQQSG